MFDGGCLPYSGPFQQVYFQWVLLTPQLLHMPIIPQPLCQRRFAALMDLSELGVPEWMMIIYK